MNINDITEDDMLPILDSYNPEWRGRHWTLDIAWDWYFGEGLLDKAIKEYER